MRKFSVDCLMSEARKSASDWLFSVTTQLSTSPRTFQLAHSLLDLFHAAQPTLCASELTSVAAAAIMLASKLFEDFDLSTETIVQFPGICADPEELLALERALLSIANWALDLPTATDIIDFLTGVLHSFEVPEQSCWEEYCSRCYRSSAMRHGPAAIAVAGLRLLTRRPTHIDGLLCDPALLASFLTEFSPLGDGPESKPTPSSVPSLRTNT